MKPLPKKREKNKEARYNDNICECKRQKRDKRKSKGIYEKNLQDSLVRFIFKQSFYSAYVYGVYDNVYTDNERVELQYGRTSGIYCDFRPVRRIHAHYNVSAYA